MIAIVNMGAPDKKQADNPDGIRIYEVRINRQKICDFMHWREDGLATCLRKAAEAVDIYEGK